MKIIIFFLIAIYCLQVLAVISAILTEVLVFPPFNVEDEDKIIQSKSDVIIFLIPFYWAYSLIRRIIKWWDNLKY